MSKNRHRFTALDGAATPSPTTAAGGWAGTTVGRAGAGAGAGAGTGTGAGTGATSTTRVAVASALPRAVASPPPLPCANGHASPCVHEPYLSKKRQRFAGPESEALLAESAAKVPGVEAELETERGRLDVEVAALRALPCA